MPLLHGAEPYQHDGGPVGVLLCHGFTGCPQSLRPWAEYLAEAGMTVSLPRLPGHGTSWRELNLTQWEDWYSEIERSFTDLTGRCEIVVVAGLSMGGALALRLAQQHPAEVAGLVLVNPSVLSADRRLRLLPVARHVLGSLPGIASDIKKPGTAELAYDRTPLRALFSLTRFWSLVQQDMGLVRAPLLLFRSTVDHVVEPASSAFVLDHVSSEHVEERLLTDSYHVATLDNDAPTIFAGSLTFIQTLTPAPAEG
ncbi:MAG: alpha/beta hydrolase [Actinomycetes bacterium]